MRGLERTFGVVTDTNGNFATVFTPLPNEGGVYTVAAVVPGITSAPPQSQFTIFGAAFTPASSTLSVTEGGSAGVSVTLQNLSEAPLTGLSVTLLGVAGNLTGAATLSTNFLVGQGAVTLTCKVSASDASIRQSGFTLQVTSAEGAAISLPVSVSVQPLLAVLVATPSQLGGAMLRGAQTIVQFDLVNLGGSASGPLNVNLPATPWMSLASTNPLPLARSGGDQSRHLGAHAPANLALGPYTGRLTVSGSGAGLAVPFAFICVSDAHGALRVHSVDQFTFFASGSPPLTNANLAIIEPFSRTVVATGITDTNGLWLITNLAEGTYELDLTADQHTPFKGSATVTAGTTNDVEAFLSRQTVTYTWTVVPTQVQDVTLITVQAAFEANVPAPVIVPSPASLDFSSLDAPGKFMNVPISLANYGLIGVQGVAIRSATIRLTSLTCSRAPSVICRHTGPSPYRCGSPGWARPAPSSRTTRLARFRFRSRGSTSAARMTSTTPSASRFSD